MNFTELGVNAALVTGLEKQGIAEPTPIQIAAYPVLKAGQSAYLQAETGTGKTLAYLVPLMERVDPKLAATQLVVLAPTYELAIQIQRQATDLAQNSGLPLRVLLLIGGTHIDRQIEKLKKKPHVAVGSPGRVRELITMGKLKVQNVGCLVVDEADRVMSPEGLPMVQGLVKGLPGKRQSGSPGRDPTILQLVFASATEQLASSEAIRVMAPSLAMLKTAEAPVNPNIEHLYVLCEERQKPDLVRKLIHATKPVRAIVFCHRVETADVLRQKLAFHHVEVADLHAANDKHARKRAMDDFRSGRAPVLIASDVAARGLDVPEITHVFNMDAPSESKGYLHRVGRAARAGASGQAVTLMAGPEARLVKRYEKELGIRMHLVAVREGELQRLDPERE